MSAALDRLREHMGRPFTEATALPAEAYTSPEVRDAEREMIFASEWICVARVAELVNVGDHVVAEVPSGTVDAVEAEHHRSLLVVRASDVEVVVFENVCVHRGATLVEGAGTTSRFTCPYHAWTYRLDGQLVAAPYMQGSVEEDGSPFDVGCHELVRVRSELWQGFVFVTSDDDARPLGPRLTELDAVLGRYRLADYVPVHREVDVWDTNWKCLVENFMDAYHVFKVHRATFGAGGDSTLATTMCPGTAASAHHVVVDEPGGEHGESHPSDDRLEGTWRQTTVLAAAFPTLVMQVQPDWLWYLQISPLGTARVRIAWHLAIAPVTLRHQPDPAAYVAGVVDLLHRVNAEDRPVVEGVRRGQRRSGLTSAPLSYLERNVYDFDQYVVGRLVCVEQP